ncbi:hypothetical protein QFC24_007058 [Naganishia onofrii]|uniref:Uncharacterized protein n=1 Tax=Naganishia onofrii TaxID=1851511 RepID=A0ACC2WU35_9TREE|nr:hypothetical protein QFC24_007058 [Naganishia onofrii]
MPPKRTLAHVEAEKQQLESQVALLSQEITEQNMSYRRLLKTTGESHSHISTAAKRVGDLEKEVKKWKDKSAHIEQQLTTTDEEALRGSQSNDPAAVFLDIDDQTQTEFCKRMIAFVLSLCFRKATQKNWHVTELISGITDSPELTGDRRTNPWNAYTSHKTQLYKDGIPDQSDDENDPDEPEIDPILRVPSADEGKLQKKLKRRWAAKSEDEKAEWFTKWQEDHEAVFKKRKVHELTDKGKETQIVDLYEKICRAIDKMGRLGMHGCLMLMPDYFCEHLSPMIYISNRSFAAALHQRVFHPQVMLAQEKEPEETRIMRVLKDGYRLYAATRYGSGDQKDYLREHPVSHTNTYVPSSCISQRELESQAQSKDAQAILNDITAIITETFNKIGVPALREKANAGHKFSWGGLYEFCAENKVAYTGVPLDFKWRNFRKKTKGLFKEHKMIFLRGNFKVYRLKEDDIEHHEALWTLKACAKAQGLWRSEAGKAEPELWKLWDAEVDKEYKSLSGGKARNVSSRQDI